MGGGGRSRPTILCVYMPVIDDHIYTNQDNSAIHIFIQVRCSFVEDA